MVDVSQNEKGTVDKVLDDLFGMDNGNPFNAASNETDTRIPGEEQQKVVLPELPPKQEGDDNDANRYQYHQSRADRAIEENARLKAKLELFEQEKQQVAQSADEEFPPPPNEPEAPFGFSEEDARVNQTGESAKYVRSYGKWQADMLKYNTYLTQYSQLKYQEELQSLKQKMEEDAKSKQAYEEQTKQVNGLKGEVQSKYKFEPSMADDFIRVMSDPENFNLDNQVKFYLMLKGVGGVTGKTTPQFAQSQNAQQFGPAVASLGVAAVQTNTGKSEDDMIFDALKNIEDKANWTAPRK